jgi:hypothetical protein
LVHVPAVRVPSEGFTMIITILYYLLVAYVVFLMIWNIVKSKKWQEEVLYVIVLIPFLLRLLRLK